MPTRAGDRRQLIADTALALLARHGVRGLTHRAVDAAAGLPPGSTSYYARTRAALLEAAIARMADRELALLHPPLRAGVPGELERLAATVAQLLHSSVTSGRDLTLARYELALVAAHQPDLAEAYHGIGERFRRSAAEAMAALGSTEPHRHGQLFVAWCEGIIFEWAVRTPATTPPPTPAEFTGAVRTIVTGLLAAAPVPVPGSGSG